MENMLLVLEKKIPLHAHVHRSDDICTAIRIAQEYDVRLVLVHCTDGISVKDYLAKFDYPAICGPAMYPKSKQESWARSFATAGELNRKGIKVCITADHDVTPLCHLSVYAAMTVRYGLDELEGLKAITKYPFAYDSHVNQVIHRRRADDSNEQVNSNAVLPKMQA